MKLISVTVALFLLCANLVLAQDKPDCSDQQDQNTMTICAQMGAVSAQAKLDEAFSLALARAQAYDKENEPDRPGNPFINSEPMADLLARSQQGWSSYRDTTCEMKAESVNGSMFPVEVANCQEEMSLEQADRLDNLFTN